MTQASLWPADADDVRIVEGLLTTENVDGTVNVAPMGPMVDQRLSRFLLRPFPGSRTYDNLFRTRKATFHITDDVELIAQGAIGSIHPPPPVSRTADGYYVLEDCCRWYELRVVEADSSGPRAELICEVLDQGTRRDFLGFNRAKHAVLEAAILATRVGLLPPGEIRTALEWLEPWVEKTGAAAERRAFALLREFIAQRLTPENGTSQSPD